MATQRLQTGDPWAAAATTLGKAFTDDPNELARAAYYGSASAKAQADAQIEVDKADATRRAGEMLARGQIDNATYAELLRSGQSGNTLGQSILAMKGNQPGATPDNIVMPQLAAGQSWMTTKPSQDASLANTLTQTGMQQAGENARNAATVAATNFSTTTQAGTAANRLAQERTIEDEKLVNVIDLAGNERQVKAKMVRDFPDQYFLFNGPEQAASIRARLSGKTPGGDTTATAPRLSTTALTDMTALIQNGVNSRLKLPVDDTRVKEGKITGVDLAAIRSRAEELHHSGALAGNITGAIDQAIDETVGRMPTQQPTGNWWQRNAPAFVGGTYPEVVPGATVPPAVVPGAPNNRVTVPGKGGTGGTGGTVGAGYAPPGSDIRASGTPLPGSKEDYAPGDKRVDPGDDSPLAQQWRIGRNLQVATGTPAWMTMGIRNRESGLRDNAATTTGSTGETAHGVMQVQQGALDDVNRALGTKYTTQDLERDATLSSRVGATYARMMQNRYGDDRMALAAYNWGPGRLDDLLSRNGGDANKAFAGLPPKVQEYVNEVMSWKPGSAAYAPPAPAVASATPPVPPAPAPGVQTGPIPPGPGAVPSIAPPGPIPQAPAPPAAPAPGLPGSNLSAANVNAGYMPGGFGAMGSPFLAALASGFGGPFGGAPGGVATQQQPTVATAPVTTPQPASASTTPSPRGAINVGGKPVPIAQVLADARSAIQRGANREAVIRKLKSMGVQPVGI